MFNSTSLLEAQLARGAKLIGSGVVERDKDWVVKDCRKYITEHSHLMRNLDLNKKREKMKTLILDYLDLNKPVVSGFTDANGTPDLRRLNDMLQTEIMDYGILTKAILDPEVYELRLNCKEVKIEKGGKIVDLKDDDGKVLSFTNREQQETVLRKILGDVRLNPKFAVVNARTQDGYRVAAVHHTAISPDPLRPTEDVYNAAVIRKFKQSKMNLNDIVKYKTMSDNMAKLCSVLAAGGCTFFTVGPTASGKTTTNNAILQAVPADTRTVLLQNPSEIDLRKREEGTGRIYNDVLHLEGREIENPSPYDPTVPNLMDHILRLSPTFVCFGELRSDKEFRLGLKIGRAGHPLNATYHAEDSQGGAGRFVEAVIAESGNMPYHLALSAFAQITNFIIVQKIMRDGTRKVLEITEVVGIDPENENRLRLNKLYEFVPMGEPVYNSEGKVIDIPGVHVRVGSLSLRTIKKFKFEGIPTNKYSFLLNQVNVERDEQGNITNMKELETETYVGENDLSLVGKIEKSA